MTIIADKIYRLTSSLQRRIRTAVYSLGDQVYCPYCKWHGSEFLPAGARQTPNRLCPQCGSLERYRILLNLLKQEPVLAYPEIKVLEIAKKKCFADFCHSLPNVFYVSSDLQEPGAAVFTDLTQSGFANDVFEVIVCLHVFEHIRDDLQGFRELKRILRPGGVAMISVPLGGEVTFEDPTAHPEAYQRLFGQEDHVRVYGMDIVQRIESVGLTVSVIDAFSLIDTKTIRRQALKGDDRYFFRITKAT